MRLFHPLNSLVVSKNLWQILSSKSLLFSNVVTYIKKCLKLLGFQIWAYFSLALVLLNYYQFCDYSLNKSSTAYLRPMLPPGDINWELIYPNLSPPGTRVYVTASRLHLARKFTLAN
jgi:hypothetical protein